MRLRVITNEREELSVETASVKCPGILGEFELLPGHTDFISILRAGEIHYSGNTTGKYHLNEGILSIKNNNILVLVRK